MVTITKEKVLENLKGLKVNKSPEPEGLHPRALKEMSEEIVEALLVIFQESLESRRESFVLSRWTSPWSGIANWARNKPKPLDQPSIEAPLMVRMLHLLVSAGYGGNVHCQ
eukprot:g38917.t1